MNEHYLMFEDKVLALFRIENDIVGNAGFNKQEEKYLPLGVRDKGSFVNWVRARGIPATRDGVKKQDNLFLYMLDNLGLSLTDHYWMKPSDREDLTWGGVNLYQNDFKESLSLDQDFSIIKGLAGKTNFVPSASLKGDLKKKWIIDQDGTRILVKGNYSDTAIQSISEVFASEIHRAQGRYSYAPYRFIDITSNGKPVLACSCPCFTSLNHDFVPAISIVSSRKKQNDINYFEHYLNLCDEMGLPYEEHKEHLGYVFMADFLMTNTDRHLNNFGVLRELCDLQLTRPAPVFDSGNSFFYKSAYVPLGKELLKQEITSFAGNEVNQLKYVSNRGMFDLSRVPSESFLHSLLAKDKHTSCEKMERLVKAYTYKLEVLQDFQNGANVWDFRYR